MRNLARQEDGFTLIELIFVISLAIVVLLATLQSFDVFTSETAQQTKVTDANDQVRSTMDRVVRDLRGASVIITATSTNLRYSVPDGAGMRYERICVDSGELYAFTQLNSAAAGACSSGRKVASLKSTTRTAFSYDGSSAPATPATVKNVGLTFSLDASGTGGSRSSTLRSSAAVRRTVATLPVGPPDVPVSCSEAGPVIEIGIGAAYDEDVQVDGVGSLTVSYTTNTGLTIPGGTVDPDTGSEPTLLPAGVTSVVAKITDSLGLVRAMIPKTVECVA